MTRISIIAAIDENRGLGKNNQLLCHLPADLKHFKTLTTGKPIIMGRKTYESIGRPLPNRLNIVLTQTPSDIEGVIFARNLEDAIDKAGDVDEIMVIGGEKVFAETLNRADRIYLTIIHHTFNADVFFPDLNSAHWQCMETEQYKQDEKNLHDMTFCRYERIPNIY